MYENGRPSVAARELRAYPARVSLLDRFRRPSRPLSVVLYKRPDCPLCDEMKAELEAAGLDGWYTLREVDITTDRELELRFALSVPVLEIEGDVAFEGRLTRESFTDKLKSKA